ncbi:MarR family transcriptional regulator [Microbacterium protaetiae]|uniref:MarR family transcriptional regulator n=1 Tax=Microbacterium protaetiae TaxID=2509458 RepID=A0A4V0YD20_9MICO|nr:MarR family transcriptional regulator [Microbacterium protaetiae]QAY59181.1 MarR family transcriptional regulator [Microbacterium protaetiae]
MPKTATRVDAARLGTTLDRLIRLLRRSTLPGDLSPVAASTLYTLVHSGPSRLTALAEAEHVTQPAMTQVVTRLEHAGLVARAADPHDGRAVIVEVTEAGRELNGARRRARAAVLDDLTAQLPPAARETLTAAIPVLEQLVDIADERRATR